jgi:large subunit ribosomal protein L15
MAPSPSSIDETGAATLSAAPVTLHTHGLQMPQFGALQRIPLVDGIGANERNQLLKLNELRPLQGMRHREKRLGRGYGSGHGKRCGRGETGAKSRSGYTRNPWFIGGATPLYRRLPKRGFLNKAFQRPSRPVNVADLVRFIEEGRIDATKTITLKDLFDR